VTTSTNRYRQRRRGTFERDTAQLLGRYNDATRGKRRSRALGHAPNDLLFEASGDPIALQDPEAAARLYGFAGAPRPLSVLRRIRAETFGDELSGLTDLAIWFQNHRGWSALRSAGEAVALAAEQGTWVGIRAPVSFGHVVEAVRKSVAKAKRLGPSRYQPQGWTGTMLFVRPAVGRLVSLPASPPRTRLPAEVMLVRDDAYWRRRVRDGDAILSAT
jgi:hypothetical protein